MSATIDQCVEAVVGSVKMYPDTKHDVVRMIERWNKRNGNN